MSSSADAGNPFEPLPIPEWPIGDSAIREVFDAMYADGSWGRYHGPHCQRLREQLATYHNAEHVMLCSSGTSAIELALRAAGVGSGDEVILAAYDYKANFANVLTVGARPVLIDTLPGVPVADPAQLADAITDATAAIICSHLHGSFARVNDITQIARQRDICVIEDTCQATGAVLNGRTAGTNADMGVLSFGGSKLLTSGRGGAVITDDARLAQRIRLYTQRGNDAYPLSEMQAAVLLPQLQQLDSRNAMRLQNVRTLAHAMATSPHWPIELAVDPDPLTTHDSPAFYKLGIRLAVNAGDQSAETRDRLLACFKAVGLPIDAAFSGLHLIHGRSRFRAVGELNHATELHERLMTLHHPVLLADERVIEDMIARMQHAVEAFAAGG
jgi:dTDP-4-amino-4,6-dideoxygalactose transaminase